MGLVKKVKGCWRQQDTRIVVSRSSSSGNRQVSADRLPKRSVDLLELRLTKPRNCHRIVVLGAPRVDFEESYEPTIEDFHRKLFHIGGEAYQVDLLDAASERDFPRISDHCMRRETARRGEILGEDIPFFETSAKTGTGLDAMFRALASLGGLPHETSPSRHQVIPILTYRSLYVGQRGRRGSRTRVLSAPCAAVDPLARRPSFNSDLQLVLGSSTKHNKPEKCQIQ
uniref:RASD family member 2a n=1 Tax=Maylandia zebra TaxID=106582 RepID=A0A3P9C5R9_9CICH